MIVFFPITMPNSSEFVSIAKGIVYLTVQDIKSSSFESNSTNLQIFRLTAILGLLFTLLVSVASQSAKERGRLDVRMWRIRLSLGVHGWYIRMTRVIHSLKLTWHLKMMVSNRNLLFQGSIFRYYLSFREGTPSQDQNWPQKQPPTEETHRSWSHPNLMKSLASWCRLFFSGVFLFKLVVKPVHWITIMLSLS